MLVYPKAQHAGTQSPVLSNELLNVQTELRPNLAVGFGRRWGGTGNGLSMRLRNRLRPTLPGAQIRGDCSKYLRKVVAESTLIQRPQRRDASSEGDGRIKDFIARSFQKCCEIRVLGATSHNGTLTAKELKGKALMAIVILVADRQGDAADSLGMIFELTFPDADVLVAYGGQAALDLLCERRPDVAVVDLELPVLSGEELANVLRARFPSTTPLLVAISGNLPLLASVQAGGAFDHNMSKPADVEELLRLLSGHSGLAMRN